MSDLCSTQATKLPFVIGAGLGRTGTLSLHTALNDIGYKTLHIKDTFGSSDLWVEFAKAKRSSDTVKADELAISVANRIKSDGFTATTDFPACLLYKELLQMEPDAKVILSIRSSAEAWADSVLETIGIAGLSGNKSPFMENVYPWLWEEIGIYPLGTMDLTKPLDRDALIEAYHKWNDLVISTVPKEKLLVHKSAEGYGPICKLLGLNPNDCPSEFPHVNDRASYNKPSDS